MCSLAVATARDTEVVLAAGGASARCASISSAAMSSASANSPRARRYAASMAPSVDIVGENAASPRAGTGYREGAAAVAGRSATKRASTRLLSENDDGFVVASRVARAAPAAAPTRDEGSCVPNPTRVGVDAADRSRSRDDGRADAARSADAVRPAVVPAVDCRVPRWVVASRVEPIEPSSRSDRETGVAAENVRAPAKSPRRAELARKEDVVADAAGGLVPLRALARSLAEAIASKLNWNSRCVRCDGPVATARTPTPAYALGAAAPARPEVGRRDLGRPSMDPRALEPRRGGSNDIGARRSARLTSVGDRCDPKISTGHTTLNQDSASDAVSKQSGICRFGIFWRARFRATIWQRTTCEGVLARLPPRDSHPPALSRDARAMSSSRGERAPAPARFAAAVSAARDDARARFEKAISSGKRMTRRLRVPRRANPTCVASISSSTGGGGAADATETPERPSTKALVHAPAEGAGGVQFVSNDEPGPGSSDDDVGVDISEPPATSPGPVADDATASESGASEDDTRPIMISSVDFEAEAPELEQLARAVVRVQANSA